MTEQSSGHGRDDWNRDGYIPGEQYAGEQYYDADESGSGATRQHPVTPGPGAPSGYGYGSSAQSGSAYGSSGPSGSGYGASGQGAVRPGQAMPGQGASPLWQAPPSSGAQGRSAPWQADAGTGTPSPGAPPPTGQPGRGAQAMGGAMTGSPQAAHARGFLSSLFDFSFTSFVTTKIIKVLYILITVLVTLAWLGYSVVAFRLSAVFGVLTFVIIGPLFGLIVMAFWRLVLESFVVLFRIAEDLRAVRERGDRASR